MQHERVCIKPRHVDRRIDGSGLHRRHCDCPRLIYDFTVLTNLNTGDSAFLAPALHLEVASQPNRHLVGRRQGKELFEPAAPLRLGRLSDQVVPSKISKVPRQST